MSVRVVKNKRHPSMKTILDNFHNKKDEDPGMNYGGVPMRRKSKKSLRGLEIVHVLPEAQTPTSNTDLSTTPTNQISPSNSSTNQQIEPHSAANQQPEMIKQSSSCSSEADDDDDDNKSVEDFIQDQYRFLDNHRDTSSYYSTQTTSQYGSSQHSQQSSHRGSNMTGSSSQRGSNMTSSSSSSDTVSRRQSVRFSTATITVGDSDSESDTESTANNSHMTTPTSSRNGFSSSPPQPPEQNLNTTPKISEPLPDYNQNTENPISHLDEIKLRFSRSNSAGLKPANSDKPANIRRSLSETQSQTAVETTPTDPISELKLRLSKIQASDSLTSPSQLSPKSRLVHQSDIEMEDPYLLPVKRPSAKIHIT